MSRDVADDGAANPTTMAIKNNSTFLGEPEQTRWHQTWLFWFDVSSWAWGVLGSLRTLGGSGYAYVGGGIGACEIVTKRGTYVLHMPYDVIRYDIVWDKWSGGSDMLMLGSVVLCWIGSVVVIIGVRR